MLKFNMQKLIAYLGLIIATLLWSGNFLIGKLMNQQVSPLEFSFYRWLFVITVLLPFVGKELVNKAEYIFRHKKSLIILGLLSVSIYTSFIYCGLRQTRAINAGLLNATVPMLTIVLSSIILKEKLTVFKGIGVLISTIGVIFLISQGKINEMFNLHLNVGDIFIIVAACSWATYSVLYKKLPKELSAYGFLLLTALIGEGLLLIPFILQVKLGSSMQFNIPNLISIFYAGLFSSIVAFILWNNGVKILGPTRSGDFFNLLPVFTTLLAITFLNEKFYTFQIIGISLIFSGILLVVNEKFFLKIFKNNIKFSLNNSDITR